MTHGVAWIGYMLAMVVCLPGKGFSVLDLVRTFVAGLVPFGTFLNDSLIRRKMAAA
jgi:integral membrane protein